jgi:hypothetical protein
VGWGSRGGDVEAAAAAEGGKLQAWWERSSSIQHAFALDFPKKNRFVSADFFEFFFQSSDSALHARKGSCGCVSAAAAAAWPCCPRSFCEQQRKGNVSLITLFLVSHDLYVAYSAISYDFT